MARMSKMRKTLMLLSRLLAGRKRKTMVKKKRRKRKTNKKTRKETVNELMVAKRCQNNSYHNSKLKDI